MSVFVHAQGIKTVHVVVECPLSSEMVASSFTAACSSKTTEFHNRLIIIWALSWKLAI